MMTKINFQGGRLSSLAHLIAFVESSSMFNFPWPKEVHKVKALLIPKSSVSLQSFKSTGCEKTRDDYQSKHEELLLSLLAPVYPCWSPPHVDYKPAHTIFPWIIEVRHFATLRIFTWQELDIKFLFNLLEYIILLRGFTLKDPRLPLHPDWSQNCCWNSVPSCFCLSS